MLALTILLAGGISYVILERVLIDEVDRSIAERADEVMSAVRVEGLQSRGVRVTLPQPNDFAAADIFVQITSLDGEVLAGSDNLGSLHMPMSGATLARAQAGNGTIETVDVGPARLRVLYAPVSIAGRPVAVAQIARPLVQQEAILAGLRFLLLSGASVSVLVSALIGWLLARAALRPMDQMTAVAENIGQSRDFRRRVAHSGQNDEVGRLAATLNSMLAQLETAYSELRAANARLEVTLASQRRFTADASHELRTPLTTIRGNATLLRQFPEMDPQDRSESIAQIADEAERMGRLVQDLLVLARADAGIHMSLQPVEISSLVRDVYRQALTLAEKVDVRLERADDAIVLGDRDYLRQLLLIIVDNALKYTPADGTVTLSCIRDADAVVVTVTDTGIGIGPEDLPHLFERFYRAKQARRTGGTGLGLAIAKWIASEHNGEIAVTSTPGQGSTFAVRLPLASHTEALPPPGEQPEVSRPVG